MALIEETKLYKDTYSLLQLILRARKKFDKFYRYSFAERMMMTAIDCCELLQHTNRCPIHDTASKKRFLNEFLIKFSSLRLMITICRDEQQIDRREFADILELAESIGKQATSWKNSFAWKPEFQLALPVGSEQLTKVYLGISLQQWRNHKVGTLSVLER